MEGCCVREAKKTDARKIFELMQQQAAEQNTVLPSHMTLEAFVEGGWGSSAVLLAFVAEQEGAAEGELKGYALAHPAYCSSGGRSMFITEVFVIPAARCSGVAKQLCRKVLQVAVNMGCIRCDVLVEKANKAGVSLFEKLGAQNITEAGDWHIFIMDNKAMAKLQTSCKDQEPPLVRPASPKDFPGIMTMIQELADYQKMPHGPKIDASTLLSDATPLNNFFECFVAEGNEGLAGYVLLCHIFSSQGRGIDMEDIYVRPTHRHRGLGTALMAQAAQRGLDVGASHLLFNVLSWNTSSIAFYKLMGATDVTSGRGIQMYRFVESVMKKCSGKDVQE